MFLDDVSLSGLFSQSEDELSVAWRSLDIGQELNLHGLHHPVENIRFKVG
jgi:hypothetical protein